MTALYRRALLLSAMAFMLFPWVASGQANGTSQDDQQNSQQNDQIKRQQNQRRLAVLALKLNLSDDQKRQWAQINKEMAQNVRAARQDDSLNEQQMQAQIREVHKQHDQQIQAILNPEQQAELKSFVEEQKNKQQNNSSSASPCNQAADSSKEKEDDLFAGMVPDPTPDPPQRKRAGAPK